MLFDSLAMQKMLQKYKDWSDTRVPEVVLLGRSQTAATERLYLESLAGLVPESRQKDLVGRFVINNNHQHLGAWFQLMLFGWLNEVASSNAGETLFEPEIEGNYPDFALNLPHLQTLVNNPSPTNPTNPTIIVEARAYVMDDAERRHEQRILETSHWLAQIAKPFVVTLQQLEFGTAALEGSRLVREVTRWLERTPSRPFLFQDGVGNRFLFNAAADEALTKLMLVDQTIQAQRLNLKSLRNPLQEKAKQHEALRRAGYPYIVALMLESQRYHVDNVVEAWFGKLQTANASAEGQHLLLSKQEQTIDISGLFFGGAQTRFKTISGTLVFRPVWSEQLQRRTLQAWFIQNPFTSAPLDLAMFPLVASFNVVAQDEASYTMGWQL
jgi:hypothetical protein